MRENIFDDSNSALNLIFVNVHEKPNKMLIPFLMQSGKN